MLFAAGTGSPCVAAEPPADPQQTVVVVGSRGAGRMARDSASPVDVVEGADLIATGQGSLLDALKDLVPALNSPAVGYDVGALARTFQLRGLSPSHTLVLVNGKRRHVSASLYADSDPAQGSNAVDLDLIPLYLIDHVEILRDGAAAQYGSDAIAGVVDIVLKNSKQGTDLSIGGGGYVDGGGSTGQLDLARGMALGGGGGTLTLAGDLRRHGFSNRSGDSGGPQPAKVQGDPRVALADFGYNLAQPIASGVSAYSFGTLSARRAEAWENPRQPGATGVGPVDTLYPNGFSPRESVRESDVSATVGARGLAAGTWNWDASLTYGRDQSRLRNVDTVNPDLLADQGDAQADFDVGGFTSSELTGTLDVRRSLDVSGLAGPLVAAFGLEDRGETYTITAGEPGSYDQGGSQAFPGFRPTDAVNAHRNSVAAYADLGAHVVAAWEIGLAARAEHADQVGDRVTGKLSTRYDLTPDWAVRATLSNGFHAPTLAQQHYSATTVTTGFAQIQLPLGSPGARALGAPDLKPETSRNISLGVVAQPVSGVHASIDVYQVAIDDRITESGAVSGTLAASAIAANGTALPPDVAAGNASAAFFTNGVSTRTRGIDVALDARTDLGAWGSVKWLFNGGYNKTSITAVKAAPAALAAQGIALVDAVQTSNLTTATPHLKASLAARVDHDRWHVTVRETRFGDSVQVQGYAPGPYYRIAAGSAWITDTDIGLDLTSTLTVTVGANNLFDVYPRRTPASVYGNLNYDQYSHLSPYGVNGGDYYVRLSSAF